MPQYAHRMTRIFAATDDHVVRLEADGSAERVLADVAPRAIAVDRHDPDRVYVGTFDDGIFITDDAGASWRRPEIAPADARVLAMAASAAADHVYAGTEPSNLYRSEDYGRTWEPLPALRELPSEPHWSFPGRPWTHHVRTIALHPIDSGQLTVGIELGGVMRSSDAGASWLDHNPQAHSDAHQLLTHPAVPERVYEAAGQGIAVSDDRGETWTKREHGLDRTYAWAEAVDPERPERWYVSVSRGPFAAHGGGDGESRLLRTDGNGWHAIDTWERAPELRRMPYALVAPAADELVVGLRGGVILRSSDAGETWSRVGVELDGVVALAV
jgi:photosystem II stability/assembly factor-like uncharacterized protein